MPGTGNTPDSEEQLILGLLAEAGDDYTSGEALSDKLGLSRAELWKHLETLRTKGYRIDALTSKGYRLVEMPDQLTEFVIGPLLTTHDFGRTITSMAECTSTSEVANKLAVEGASHGEAVIAEKQTAGRGRRGRNWVSPPGKNLYLSLVLRPDLAPKNAPELTFVAAVATAEALNEFGVDAQIKWPNDLEFDGKKIAGILTELIADNDKVQAVILGIGINLNMDRDDFPKELRETASSVKLITGKKVVRASFVAALLARLEHWYDLYIEEGFGPVSSRWRDLTSTLGEQVRVRMDNREIEGIAQDLDDNGALLVAVGDKVERVIAGDVERIRLKS